MVVPRNVENNLPKGTHVFGRPVTVFVFREFLRGFHKVVPHVRQVVSPSKCSGGDLACRSSPLIFLILLIVLGKPRNSHERQGATQADSWQEPHDFTLHRNRLSELIERLRTCLAQAKLLAAISLDGSWTDTPRGSGP